MTKEAEIIESSLTAIEAVLHLPLLDDHKRGIINGMLWAITEARGKYTTRYRSKAALDAPKDAKLQHEHVIPRKALIDAIMHEPERARDIARTAIGCVVTREEHRKLAAVDRTQRLHAWERYTAAGITVIDTDNPESQVIDATESLRRPFWLIDGRLREADFYLDKLRTAGTLDEARHDFSAFAVAISALPDAIVRTLAGVPKFWEWWMPANTKLQEDGAVALLRTIRNQIVHEGLNPLGTYRRSHLEGESFIITEDGERNAVETGHVAMRALTSIVTDAYARFWSALDLPMSLTTHDLATSGRTLEMIEQEFGLLPGTSSHYAITSQERLAWLKEYSRTVLSEIGHRYA